MDKCPVCGGTHECDGQGVSAPGVVIQVLAGSSAPGPAPTPSKEPGGAGSGKITDFNNRVVKKVKRLKGRPDEHTQDEPE